MLQMDDYHRRSVYIMLSAASSFLKRPLDAARSGTTGSNGRRESVLGQYSTSKKKPPQSQTTRQSLSPETPPTDDAGFERPAKVSRKTATTQRPTTATSNNFSVLTLANDLDNDEMEALTDEDKDNTTNAKTTNTRNEPGKITPIIIRDGQAWKRLGQRLDDKRQATLRPRWFNLESRLSPKLRRTTETFTHC